MLHVKLDANITIAQAGFATPQTTEGSGYENAVALHLSH